jgi:hypothetical protein
MPLQPTCAEARWLIVVLVAGSAAPALAGIDLPSLVVGGAVVASLVAWYALVFRVAAREGSPTARSLIHACVRTLDPRWYAGVVRTSRWNPTLAGAAVIAATLWTLYALVS